MRTLVGLLLLLGLCAGAWQWQTSWSDGVRAERETLRNTPSGLREREESWGELVIGRPSGAPPADVEIPLAVDEELLLEELPFLFDTEGDGGRRIDTPPAPVPAPDEDFDYVVPRGRVLSKICEEWYGSGRPPIPQRVAEYNGMSSPDALSEGQTIQLPAWERLFPEGRERP